MLFIKNLKHPPNNPMKLELAQPSIQDVERRAQKGELTHWRPHRLISGKTIVLEPWLPPYMSLFFLAAMLSCTIKKQKQNKTVWQSSQKSSSGKVHFSWALRCAEVFKPRLRRMLKGKVIISLSLCRWLELFYCETDSLFQWHLRIPIKRRAEKDLPLKRES